MYDVIAIGEMLIDFTPTVRGVGLAEVPAFEKKPGGAPANVAVGVAKLGGRAAFVGKFAEDPFADFLIGTLEAHGVDTVGCVRTHEAKTGLAFISLGESGEHDFHFYREPSADMLLEEADIREDWIQNARIVHVGSVTQVLPDAFAATCKALEMARRQGVVTSFDVNFRRRIWQGREEEGKRKIFDTIALTDVLKVSESEMLFLTGMTDVEQGAQMLQAKGPKIVLVTLGGRGVYYLTDQHKRLVPTFPVQQVDVTGAGDGFVAGFLRQLADRIQARGLDVSLSMHEEIEEMVRYGSAVGALTVSKVGAIPALPTQEEVFQFMYRKAKRNPLRVLAEGN